ncbi:MAG: hypothetical protein ABWZ29_00065 [Casimicrobiaceae bacterium]
MRGIVDRDQHLRDSREPLELRDNAVSTEATNLDPPFPAGYGTKPVGTRVPTTYALASAYVNGYPLFPDMVQDMVDAALSTAGN